VKGQPKNLKVYERGNDINSKLSFHVSNERRFVTKLRATLNECDYIDNFIECEQ
jgi:hypothetical protein